MISTETLMFFKLIYCVRTIPKIFWEKYSAGSPFITTPLYIDVIFQM
jgi:hypothetical protein